jgi:hypothetical protein
VAVLLADRLLGVRARIPGAVDAHGDRYAASWAPLRGPWPGRAMEGPDTPPGQVGDRTWRLAVDPAGWPLAQGDLVEEADADGVTVQSWLVLSADLMTHTVDDMIDYIRVEAHARTGDAAGETRP